MFFFFFFFNRHNEWEAEAFQDGRMLSKSLSQAVQLFWLINYVNLSGNNDLLILWSVADDTVNEL